MNFYFYWLTILKWLKELFILEKRESKVLWPMRIVDFSLSHFLKMKGQIIRIYSIWFRNQTQTEKIRKNIREKREKMMIFINWYGGDFQETRLDMDGSWQSVLGRFNSLAPRKFCSAVIWLVNWNVNFSAWCKVQWCPI